MTATRIAATPGVREYLEELAELTEETQVEFPEVHDLGDRVLGLGHFSLRFASGVEPPYGAASWSKASWLSHAEALEAAGLRE